MKLIYFGALLTALVVAQTPATIAQNYVANTANASSPGFGNVLVGPRAGVSLRTAQYNVFIGDSAGYNIFGGQRCVFIGAKAGFGLNSPSIIDGTFVGHRAGASNVADYNTFIGSNAGADGNNTTAILNTFVGSSAGQFNVARANTFIGASAGAANTTGTNNVFVGALNADKNTTGSDNSFVGTLAAQSNTTGNANTALGSNAARYNVSGYGNVSIGAYAGVVNKTGSSNTMIGDSAGFFTNSSANTLIGYRAGFSNTSGQFNTFVGVQAGINNTTGNSNFIMGTNAGSNNTSGTANFFLGDNAGGANTTGGFNVFLGTNAGASNSVGSNNTAIGFEANVGSGALVNATAIGFRAVASANNSLVLGNGANVGIGTSTPSAKLHLVSGTDNQSGLRLQNLTSNSPASATGQTKFLTVDGAGNVVLGSTTSGGRVGADLWQQKGQYLQSIDESAVIIGQGISKTPADYNLFVSKGILTEKVKVAVKNASEWSDYVFEKNYKLAPLAEVEQHIKENGHLPGVPSAAEVVEKGIDMAKMDAKLLEKIEELTLYMIDVKKEVNALRQENQQLKQELKATQNKLK